MTNSLSLFGQFTAPVIPILFTMPLVVPGITAQGGQDLTQEWMTKLMGKQIGDKHDEVVRISCIKPTNPILTST